jgi:anti-sigma regulatory factor (Ser/Thr protein kinase)
VRIHLIGDVQAPAAARNFVRTGLRSMLAPSQQSVADDLALIVSELVTNSVRASASAIDVELRTDDGRIEVHVTDDASGWPTIRPASADSLNGRGLEIVDHLADSWHTVPRRPGKTVIATRQISDWTPASS